MERQSIGRALFGGQGGFFVMTTQGEGTLLVNAFGAIKKIELKDQEMTIDNAHAAAWIKKRQDSLGKWFTICRHRRRCC